MAKHKKPQSTNTTKNIGSRGNSGTRASGKVNEGGDSNGRHRKAENEDKTPKK